MRLESAWRTNVSRAGKCTNVRHVSLLGLCGQINTRGGLACQPHWNIDWRVILRLAHVRLLLQGAGELTLKVCFSRSFLWDLVWENLDGGRQWETLLFCTSNETLGSHRTPRRRQRVSFTSIQSLFWVVLRPQDEIKPRPEMDESSPFMVHASYPSATPNSGSFTFERFHKRGAFVCPCSLQRCCRVENRCKIVRSIVSIRGRRSISPASCASSFIFMFPWLSVQGPVKSKTAGTFSLSLYLLINQRAD